MAGITGARVQLELAECAVRLAAQRSEPDIARVVVAECLDLVPGATGAAFVRRTRSGDLDVVASTDPVVAELVAVESRLRRGPVTSALTSRTSDVHVLDTAAGRMWRECAAEAAGRGIRSALGVRVNTRDRHPGVLMVTALGFDDESSVIAAAFALHVQVALDGLREQHDLATALISRDVIGQAKGILMERHRITGGAAFDVLVVASQASQTKLRDVAEQLCMTGELRGLDRESASIGIRPA
jgi:hypothetical protein